LPQSFNAFSSIVIVLFLVSQAEDMVRESFKVIPWTTVIFLQLFVSCFAGELIKSRAVREVFSTFTVLYQLFNTK
ncbi:Odorant receptor 137, partial [Halyomorpha halys]